jgi:membrane-associated phospholipid phosphatase
MEAMLPLVSFALVLAGTPSFARAQDVEGTDAAASADAVEWNPRWSRFRAWEYVATPALLAISAALRFAVELEEPNWTSGILFDDALADSTLIHDLSVRDAWTLIGDIPFYASIAYPHVDAVLSAGLVHGRWDVALEIGMMNVEAFVAVAAVIWITQLFVRRERPRVSRCLAGVFEWESECRGGDWLRSFPGGHVMIASTAAALTCTHHLHLPLWGSPGADAMACGLGIAAVTLTFASRVLTTFHYFSDNLAGVAIGVLAGWLLPTALHYGFDSDEREASGTAVPAGVLVPFAVPRADDGGIVGGVSGVF